MKTIKIAGLIAVLSLTVSALYTIPAFALEWLVDGTPVPSTAKVHVEFAGTLTLEDAKAGVGMECNVGGLGLVWESHGTVEEFPLSNCKIVKGSCGSPAALPHNLDWNTELVVSGTEWLDRTSNGGKGAPGWDFSCFGFIEDTCTSESGTQTAENMSSETPPDVLLLFLKVPNFICTLGGVNAGTLSGEMLVVALEGLGLGLS